MEDFEMAVDTLRTIRAETIAIDKWMGQLATFLDKSNIEVTFYTITCIHHFRKINIQN